MPRRRPDQVPGCWPTCNLTGPATLYPRGDPPPGEADPRRQAVWNRSVRVAALDGDSAGKVAERADASNAAGLLFWHGQCVPIRCQPRLGALNEPARLSSSRSCRHPVTRSIVEPRAAAARTGRGPRPPRRIGRDAGHAAAENSRRRNFGPPLVPAAPATPEQRLLPRWRSRRSAGLGRCAGPGWNRSSP